MRTGAEAAHKGQPPTELVSNGLGSQSIKDLIVTWLDEAKAEKIVAIDLKGKTSLGDYMIIATGRTDRHVGACADQVVSKLKDLGYGRVRVEGADVCDWVLIDSGDIIVHLFRPEVREFYNLEKMWSGERPQDQAH